jgi:hypothetical protein
LGLLYRFILPSWEIENPSTYSMHWNLRYQFYFSKKIRSKGLYVFAQTGFRFAKNYSKLTIEYASTQSKEVYAYNYKNITMGGGLGYQWIIKKRVILGFELMYIQYLTGKKQYVSYINNSVNKDPWEKTTSQNSSYLLFFLNLGYTF